ncbi:MAG: hypothetical protein V7K50_07215 [Nostoc sp.]|uniref:helix-turn-helix transcriptional regulator n=1 Tax=Nostoc sp. TaxID=1180 RepID=UPI002FF9BC9D
MSQKLVPARVPTPGKILSRELEARGWTQKDLAEIMGRPVQTINEFIIRNKKVFSRKAIEEFAQNQNRHPGIILGHLHYDKLVPYKNFRPLLVKVSPIFRSFYR